MVISPFQATSLSLDFPDFINFKEFNVSIQYDYEENLDVKIFVHNSSDNSITRDEIISQIWDSGWKDSWFYIPEAFPSKKQFSVQLRQFPAQAEICVQLRIPKRTSFLEKHCQPIFIDYKPEMPQKPLPNNYSSRLSQTIYSKSYKTEYAFAIAFIIISSLSILLILLRKI